MEELALSPAAPPVLHQGKGLWDSQVELELQRVLEFIAAQGQHFPPAVASPSPGEEQPQFPSLAQPAALAQL